MTKRVEDLVQRICDSPDHPLTEILRRWCTASRPVLEFVEAHATKLRKKVRLARSDDEWRDLLAELAVGTLLAQDRRFQVQYEPPPVTGARAPDFSATYKGHTRVYVEVTRVRWPSVGPATAALRLARVLSDKVSQGVPGALNVLTVILPPDVETEALIPAALRVLQAPGTGQAPDLDGAPERRSTFRRLQGRLSRVLLCSLTPDGQLLAVTAWDNPQAKQPLPPELARVLTFRPVVLQGGTPAEEE